MKTWYKVKVDWGYGSVIYIEYHRNRTAAVTSAMLNFSNYLIENSLYIAQLKITTEFRDCYKLGDFYEPEEGAKE